MISNFLLNFTKFLTKLLTLGIIFSIALRALVVAKLVTLGISPLTSIILALREALVAKLIMLGMLGISPLALRAVLVAKLVMSHILSSIFFYLSIL